MAGEVILSGGVGPDNRSTRRDFIVGGALAATAVLAARGSGWGESRPSTPAISLAAIVPKQFGKWRSSPANGVVIPTAEAPANTGYDDLLTRHFVDDAGRIIMFLVAYGAAQSGNTQLHRPESCYPAAGFSLGDSGRTSLEGAGGPKIEARTLTATRPGRIEHILYWSRVGAAFPTDSASQSLAVIRQSFSGSAPDGALVRMSTLSPDPASALTLLRLFANDLLQQPAPSLRRLLTGQN